MITDELELQQTFSWTRSIDYSDYNAVLAHYQAKSVIEHKRGRSVLDLACGDGLLTSTLVPHFDRIVGVDAATAQIARARKRLPSVEFREGLIEDVELDEKFDTVLLLMILEHVQDPVYTLSQAARHLNPGGVLIAHVPNANAINRQLAVLMGTLTSCDELSPFDINVVGHRRTYTIDSLVEDMKQADLTTHTTGGVFHKTFSTPQMDWFLKNGLWEEGGFGWGRVGGEQKDWKAEYCRACYELGKMRPDECNVIFAVGSRDD